MSTSLLNYFKNSLKAFPDKIAVTEYIKSESRVASVTYRDLDVFSTKIAKVLTQSGIVSGDVVSFQLPNGIPFVAVHLACIKIAAISNPVMPIFRARELSYMFSHIGTRLAIYRREYREFDYSAMYQELSDANEQLEVREVSDLLIESDTANIDSFTASTMSGDDTIEMMFTSGTTGSPKAVMHSTDTIMSATLPFIDRLELGDRDVLYMGAPMAHATGFLYGMWVPLIVGATVVVQDIWDAELAWEAIKSEKVTFTMGATPFLSDLVTTHISGRAVSLKTFVCGGAPVPRALVKKAQLELGIKVIAVWGMTECGVVTSTSLVDNDDKIYNTDGFPYGGFSIKIVDSSGESLSSGEEGRLLVKAPSLLKGYYGKQLEDYIQDGWFDSGDLAKLDDDGYLRITGRSKDIIIRGGENIPVVEVENVLYRYPGVGDVAIVGKPHSRLGETGVCFITRNEDVEIDLEDFRRYLLAEGVAKNYWPEELIVIEDMPRTPSGKIQKFELRNILTSTGV